MLHGTGRIDLLVETRDDVLRIEVADEGTGEALEIREQTRETVGGWGLRLVEDLSARWGAYEGSTHVWADLALE